MFPGAEAHAVATPYLEEYCATTRRRLLAALLKLGEDVPPEWLNWLYERWWERDRHEIGQDEDHWLYADDRSVSITARIVGLCRDRPEVAPVLTDYRRRPSEEVHSYR